jgi:phytoene dehydrogenase-like protein
MRYFTVRDHQNLRDEPFHLQLVADPDAPYVEGNHLFLSVGPRAPVRTVTASTHLALERLRDRVPEARAAVVDEVQTSMSRTLRLLAPELDQGIEDSWTASPRTFARFTGRTDGAVGGVPRHVGLASYQGLGVRAVRPGLYLVGDSVFPGQSILAAALGGARTAAVVARGAVE